MHKTSLVGYAAGVGAVFFWSFNVIISRYLANELTPWQISFGRWAVASLILLPFTGKSLWAKRAVVKRHLMKITALSLTGIVLMNTLVYQAGHTASAVNMALLGTTGPIFLVVFSAVFLKTAVSAKQICGFALALAGVLLIILKGDIFNITHIPLVSGDLYMLCMAVTFGVYGSLQAVDEQELDTIELLSATIWLGTLIMGAVFLATLKDAPMTRLTPTGIGIIIYMGLLPSLFSYFCWNIALEKLGGLKTSLIYYLMPVFSSIEAAYFLNESITKAQIYGGMCVVAGVFVAAYHHPKHQVVVHRV